MVRALHDGQFNLGPASLRSGAEPDKQAQINLSTRTNHPAHPTCYLDRLSLVIFKDCGTFAELLRSIR